MSVQDHRDAPLAGVTVVEVSAFVAAPLGAMTLAQLGADVIRIDPIGGNIDYTRWPVTADGTSLYWASLNKGKQSVTLNLKSPEGQALATELIASAGIVVTNLPTHGWLDYDLLKQHRSDLIMLRLTGWHDGSAAVDYTVNAASGFPGVTGFDGRPVNNALPAWDVIAGLYIANGVLAAELDRRSSGSGQQIKLALSDTMLATVANLGYVAEIQKNGSTRGALGNGLYGAYGQSFSTADQHEVMVVIISNRHWKALGDATGLGEKLDMLGPLLDVDLTTEGGRYEAREAIDLVLRPWFAAHSFADISRALSDAKVLHEKFQTFAELVNDDPRCSTANPLFAEIDQPGVGEIIAPKIPLRFAGSATSAARPAPILGMDTSHVLKERLGQSDEAIAHLRATGIIADSPRPHDTHLV